MNGKRSDHFWLGWASGFVGGLVLAVIAMMVWALLTPW
jgi:hypothetical protein